MFRIRPYLMDIDTGAEVPAAGGESIPETGEATGEQAPPPAAESNQESGKDFAFSKRLEAEREKLRAEYEDRYKDYDTVREVADYFREANGLDDVMSLKEKIEMSRLQERAEKSNLPPEVQQRLETLEAKAAEADEYKQTEALRSQYNEFRGKLGEFVEGKDVKADDLEQFMIDNRIQNMEIAYKAMTHTDVQSQREAIEKEAVEKYLQSKKAPRAEGAGSAGQVNTPPPKTWDQARAGAAEMLRNMNKSI